MGVLNDVKVWIIVSGLGIETKMVRWGLPMWTQEQFRFLLMFRNNVRPWESKKKGRVEKAGKRTVYY